jgi:hypothetical protein
VFIRVDSRLLNRSGNGRQFCAECRNVPTPALIHLDISSDSEYVNGQKPRDGHNQLTRIRVLPMKSSNKINSTQAPNHRSLLQRVGGVAASVVSLFVLSLCCNVLAQSDDFNDGNDTSPVAWTHYDGINAIFGGPPYNVPPQDSWTFPGGNSYRIQANPSPLPGTIGPGRVSSFPTNRRLADHAWLHVHLCQRRRQRARL